MRTRFSVFFTPTLFNGTGVLIGLTSKFLKFEEIKSSIATSKAAFNKKKNLFTSKLDLNLRKKLVKCYVWSMAVYSAETWALRATDQKRLESCWCWRRMEKTVGPIM